MYSYAVLHWENEWELWLLSSSEKSHPNQRSVVTVLQQVTQCHSGHSTPFLRPGTKSQCSLGIPGSRCIHPLSPVVQPCWKLVSFRVFPESSLWEHLCFSSSFVPSPTPTSFIVCLLFCLSKLRRTERAQKGGDRGGSQLVSWWWLKFLCLCEYAAVVWTVLQCSSAPFYLPKSGCAHLLLLGIQPLNHKKMKHGQGVMFSYGT